MSIQMRKLLHQARISLLQPCMKTFHRRNHQLAGAACGYCLTHTRSCGKSHEPSCDRKLFTRFPWKPITRVETKKFFSCTAKVSWPLYLKGACSDFVIHVLFSTVLHWGLIVQKVWFQILRKMAPVVFHTDCKNGCIALSHLRLELWVYGNHTLVEISHVHSI